jgi:N-carbamoyl-L-amino-acid hydrolase
MKLISRLHKLSRIGIHESGINRPSGSIDDQKARDLVVKWMMEAGMSVRMDDHQNVIGRLEGEGKPIVVGSHIDTGPTAGMYDGALGVIAGIEAAEQLRDELKHPLEVCVFSDEETSMAGSIGYANDNRDIEAFLELHVEQGPVLDCQGLDIGIVEGIVGQRRSELTVMGTENHAGTTPMNMRNDALVKASGVIQYVNEKALDADGLVATVGKIEVLPNAFSVVPGQVKLTLQVRDLYAETMEAFTEDVCQTYGLLPNVTHSSEPALCDTRLQEAIKSVCNAFNLKSLKMPSRASHDAQNFVHCPMAMIFVPSVGGVSHSPEEYTTDTQCANGLKVLVETIRKIDGWTTKS